MSFTVAKKNGELLFYDLGGWEMRNQSTIWCILQADQLYQFEDFKEIRIYTDDTESDETHYSYTKENSYDKLVPDFNFHAWQQVGILNYDLFVQSIDRAGLCNPILQKVGWIGNSATNFRRTIMLDIGHQNPTLFEFFDMQWIPSNRIQFQSTQYISTPDLVKQYAFLIDIEGKGYSGRLKHLLWSHRPVLLVDRPHKEYFFEHLKEWIHYIPVHRDLTDLIEKTQWCIDHYDTALQIAENAYQFSKMHLTRNACYSQWNKIIKYSK